MILAYVYDFVSFLLEKDIREIKSIVLFGSVASGEWDDQSDVDIFIDIWQAGKKASVEKLAKEQLAKFEDAASRKWYPRGIRNPFSIVVGKLDEPAWKNVRPDILSNGIMLYGKYEKIPEKKTHAVLVTFSLKKMKQRDKMKFIRELYGYETTKKNTRYVTHGILEQYGGEKVSSNAILIPIEKVKDFRKLFSQFNLTPEMRELWAAEQ